MLGVAAIVGLDVGGSDIGAVVKMVVVVVGYALGPAILSRWMSDLPGRRRRRRLARRRRDRLRADRAADRSVADRGAEPAR